MTRSDLARWAKKHSYFNLKDLKVYNELAQLFAKSLALFAQALAARRSRRKGLLLVLNYANAHRDSLFSLSSPCFSDLCVMGRFGRMTKHRRQWKMWTE